MFLATDRTYLQLERDSGIHLNRFPKRVERWTHWPNTLKQNCHVLRAGRTETRYEQLDLVSHHQHEDPFCPELLVEGESEQSSQNHEMLRDHVRKGLNIRSRRIRFYDKRRVLVQEARFSGRHQKEIAGEQKDRKEEFHAPLENVWRPIAERIPIECDSLRNQHHS